MGEADPIIRLNAALEGRYRIERELGEGGMATVYLAEDLKHERKVALKVLKSELAAVVGTDRFLAEIKTTANLQHPHILALHDSGEADGLLFYVMPYVEGESLRDRLDREHQLPVDDAVRIATNLAEALDYAHRQGVIHRDIKPANVLLQDGKPVISDFGIALAVDAAGGGRLTETGLSLGTPHYMSPEQATGDLNVGPATDIYALGCVLYEMLAGEPPFTGSTPQAVLGKIVTGDAPSASDARKAVPPNVDATIRRAMEKVPADRFHSGAEVERALGDPVFRHLVPGSLGSKDSGPFRWSSALAGFLTALVGTGVAAWLLMEAPEPRHATTFPMVMPSGRAVSIANGWAVSPDGRIVIVQDSESGLLYRRDLGSLPAVPIPNTDGAFNPFFSPNGEWLGFIHIAEGTLYKVRLDGTELTLIGGDVPPASRSAVWNPDGTIVYASTNLDGLWRISDSGGEPERVPNTEGYIFRWMGGLPGGGAVLAGRLDPDAEGDEAGLAVAVSLDSGEQTILQPGIWPRYIRGGYLLYWRDGSIWAVRFDADRLRVGGAPTRVVSDVTGALLNGYAWFEVGGGTLLFGTAQGPVVQTAGTPVWLRRDGSEDTIPGITSLLGHPALSPDGRRIAFAEPQDRTFKSTIWVYEIGPGAGTLSRLTPVDQDNRQPFWSPDGREVGFSSSRSGLYAALYSRPWDQSSEARLLRPAQTGGLYEGRWTPGGQLFYRVGDFETTLERDVWRAAPHPDSTSVAVLAEPGDAERNPAPSPDGTLLAYTSDQSGRTQVYVQMLTGGGGRMPVSQSGGINPVWSPSGDELFYIDMGSDGGTLFSATIQREPELRVLSREALFPWTDYVRDREHPNWDVAPDGQRFVAIRGSPDSALRSSFVIVDNFDTKLSRLLPN